MFDYLLNMVWTISAGLLSLVALLGIFVSISSQQKIQKRRELFWELFQPENRSFDRSRLSKEQIVENARYLQKKYRLYSYLEANESKGIFPKALDAAVFLINTVVVFWIIGASGALYSGCSQAVLANSNGNHVLEFFVVVVFLGLLYWGKVALGKIQYVMELLRTPWKNEELPSTIALLDVSNTEAAIDTLNYLKNTLLVSLRLIRYETKDWIQLRLVYPLPFYGFSVTPEIKVRYRDGKENTFRNFSPFQVTYEESHSPSEMATPIIFNIELAEGAKERISAFNVSLKIRAGEREEDANVEGEIDISELNDWNRPSVFVISRTTEAEMKLFDEHNIAVSGKIE